MNDQQLECPKCGAVQSAFNKKCQKCGAPLLMAPYMKWGRVLTALAVGSVVFLLAAYVLSLVLTGTMP